MKNTISKDTLDQEEKLFKATFIAFKFVVYTLILCAIFCISLVVGIIIKGGDFYTNLMGILNSNFIIYIFYTILAGLVSLICISIFAFFKSNKYKNK